uniref:DUF4781 domain-containing protein n=1 Tax=Clastoptera arizonana TaxID=38151 RepID=A0A1B6CQT8_9HEMI
MIITPEWMQASRSLQGDIFKVIGQRSFDEIDEPHLFDKIIFVLCGLPNQLEYTKEQKALAHKIKTVVQSQFNGKIYLGIIYGLILEKDTKNEYLEIVFKVGNPKRLEDYVFIDKNCRVYHNWNDFLKNNKLPKCIMCWPQNGIYETFNDTVKLDFKPSHACSKMNFFLSFTNTVSTIGNAAGLTITLTSFFTPIGIPLTLTGLGLNVASSVYDTVKGTCELIDKHDHNESLSLTDSSARSEWVSVITSSLNIVTAGSSAILLKASEKGTDVAVSLFKALKILKISSVCVSSLSVVNEIVNVIDKCIRGHLKVQDVKRFLTSCLYLFNAIVSYDMGVRIISEIASYGIATSWVTMRSFSSSVKNKFYKMFYVDKPDQFYGELLTFLLGPKEYVFHLLSTKIKLRFPEISSKMKLFTSNYNDAEKQIKQISQPIEEYITRVIDSVKTWRFEYNPIKIASYMKEENKQIISKPINFVLINKLYFYIRDTAEHFGLNQTEEAIRKKEVTIMRYFEEFNSRSLTSNLNEYYLKLTLYCEQIIFQYKKMKEDYDNDYDIACNNVNFDLISFNRNHGIQTNVQDHFFQKSLHISHSKLKEIESKFKIKIKEENTLGNNFFEELKCGKIAIFYFPGEINSSFSNAECLKFASTFANYQYSDVDTKIKVYNKSVIVVEKVNQDNSSPRVLLYRVDNINIDYNLPPIWIAFIITCLS